MVCETSASKSTSICLDYSRYLGDPRYQWCRCCTSQVPQTHKEWADAGRGIRSQQDPAGADGVANRCPKQHKHDRRLLEVSWRASTHALCWWGHQSPVGANQMPPFFYGLQTLLLRPYIYIYEFSTEIFFSSRHWILQGFESREKVNFNKGQLVWMDHSSIVIFFLIKIEILLKFVWMNHDGSSIVFLFLICVRIHIRILLLWEHIHELWICGAWCDFLFIFVNKSFE